MSLQELVGLAERPAAKETIECSHVEHVDLNESVKVLSESGFYALTGEQIVVPSGEYRVVSTSTESDIYHYTNTGTFLTNMATRETIPAKFGGYAHYDFLAGPPGYYLST